MKASMIFFDLDDTLVPSKEFYDKAMIHIGIDPQDPTYLQARSEVKKNAPSGYPGSRFRRNYFKRYLEIQGRYSARKHLALSEKYESSVVEQAGFYWKELKRAQLFQELKSKGIRCAIVSNESAHLQAMKLNQFDPDGNLFEFMITSEEMGVEKPDPRIFSRALEMAQLKAEQCLFVGDSLEMDVVGAKQMGMNALRTIEFSRSSVKAQNACPDISDLNQVLNFI